jgi:hypothetical protein
MLDNYVSSQTEVRVDTFQQDGFSPHCDNVVCDRHSIPDFLIRGWVAKRRCTGLSVHPTSYENYFALGAFK